MTQRTSPAGRLLFLFLLSSFFLLFRLGNGSLASWDEAIYASVAKEVFQSGGWLRFTFGGDLWFDKPPLCIWATALSYKLFGVSEFSARLFPALTGIGTVLVTYLAGRRLLGDWAGFLGALVLLSSSHFLHFSRFAMMDVPLTFFLSLSFYFFWLGRERNRYLALSGAAVGLAFLTKGFAAFLVFPVVWLYAWWAGELKVLGRSSYWVGVMIAVAIALPWNLYEMIRYRETFMQDVVVKHLFVRTSRAIEGHAGNLYFYVRTMVNKYHPWALVAVFSAPFFLWKAARERKEETVFLAAWIFVIFGAITLIRTKLHWYIFPIYPALSLSVGSVLAKIAGERKRWWVSLLFAAGLSLHIPYSHILNHDYSRDIKGLASTVKEKVPPSEKVYLYNYHETPAAWFYTERKSDYLDDPGAFVQKAKEGGTFFCLIHEKHWTEIQGLLKGRPVSVEGVFEGLKLLKVS
ncbi:MAG: glycosyltransferase family 39 protein [Candidatus Omnitrophica bacterium]|nr:glycosyltransferase family 39 protein [Candidatus Omnitrophota bacterium]